MLVIMKEEKEISISIKEIIELSFNQKPLPSSIKEEDLANEIALGLSFRFNVDFDKETFKFNSVVSYTLKETNSILLELESEIVFEINNITSVVKATDQDELNIDNDILITLAGVSIGTTRGILSTKTKGNILSKFPLPILNPQEVLKEMNQSQDQ